MAAKRKTKAKAKRSSKKLAAWVRSQIKKSNPKRKRAASRKRNPVRVGATVTGTGTGWIKAKAVRVVRGKNGAARVEVKR